MSNTRLKFPIGIEIEPGIPETQANIFPRLNYGNHTLKIPELYDWSSSSDGGKAEFASGKIEFEDALFNEVRHVTRILNDRGYYITGTSGLHIHVGFKHVPDLGAKYRLFRFMSCYENLFLKLANPVATRNNFCKPIEQAVWSCAAKGAGYTPWKEAVIPVQPQPLTPSIQTIPSPTARLSADGTEVVAHPTEAAPDPRPEGGLQTIGKHRWANVKAMFSHGTIEFRCFNGTLDHEEILGWACVLLAMFDSAVNKALKLDWHSPDHASLDQFMIDLQLDDDKIGKTAKKFLNKFKKQH